MLFGMRPTPARVRRTLAHQGLPTDVPGGSRSIRVRSVGYSDGIVTFEAPESGEFSADVRLAALGVSEEITVVGFRVAQLSALQAKKSTVVILDASARHRCGHPAHAQSRRS